MKTLLLQRICSSFASGRATAREAPPARSRPTTKKPHWQMGGNPRAHDTPKRAGHLDTIVDELSRPEARDPKTAAVKYFLTEHPERGERPGWTTAASSSASTTTRCARSRACWRRSCRERRSPSTPARARAASTSAGDFASVEREEIKIAVRRHEIRLLVATDAACEGTQPPDARHDDQRGPALESLHVLSNGSGASSASASGVKSVDMLNLVYHDTQDEKVYAALSQADERPIRHFRQPSRHHRRRLDRERRTHIEEMMDRYMHLRAAGARRLRDPPRASGRSGQEIVGNAARACSHAGTSSRGCPCPGNAY